MKQWQLNFLLMVLYCHSEFQVLEHFVFKFMDFVFLNYGFSTISRWLSDYIKRPTVKSLWKGLGLEVSTHSAEGASSTYITVQESPQSLMDVFSALKSMLQFWAICYGCSVRGWQPKCELGPSALGSVPLVYLCPGISEYTPAFLSAVSAKAPLITAA